jgi:hypothetical protein
MHEHFVHLCIGLCIRTRNGLQLTFDNQSPRSCGAGYLSWRDMSNEQVALLAIVRAAGQEGRSTSELRLGCRCISGQEAILTGLEADGLVRSEDHPMAYAGRLWRAVEGAQ